MKNWRLFHWAINHLKIENNNPKKCWQNSIIWWLIDLSGVKPKDMLNLMQQIDNELARRGSLN